MSEVEWAVLGYDKKDKSEFIDRTPESREEAESQIARFYSRPSQYRDVRVVSRTVGEWGTPSSGVTEGKAESGEQIKHDQKVPDRNHALNVIAGELSSLYGWLPLTHRYSAAHEALAEVERRLGLPVGRDLFPRRGPLEPPQPPAPADDAATVLAGLVESIQRRARFCYGDYQRALHEAIALVEAAQQRLADRGQSGMPDEFEPYLAEAMKRPGFRAAYEAALRDEENTDG